MNRDARLALLDAVATVALLFAAIFASWWLLLCTAGWAFVTARQARLALRR